MQTTLGYLKKMMIVVIIQSIMLAVMLADEPSLSSINPFCRPPSLPSPLFVAFPISIHLMVWFGIELERAIQYANGGNIILMITWCVLLELWTYAFTDTDMAFECSLICLFVQRSPNLLLYICSRRVIVSSHTYLILHYTVYIIYFLNWNSDLKSQF